MNGVKQWAEGPLVDSACPNENCAEHMVAVRYPATMEWIDHRNVVFAYFDLPMRCSTCGSLYPPANEGQLDVEPTPVTRMRRESGLVNNDDRLVMFIYLLARDWVPTGTIDKIVDYEMPTGTATFTNGWLAQWAKDVVDRLDSDEITRLLDENRELRERLEAVEP